MKLEKLRTVFTAWKYFMRKKRHAKEQKLLFNDSHVFINSRERRCFHYYW